MNGFDIRSGRDPEASGIWVWSEVFTHDFDNGDKVAIILLDTQDIIDLQSPIRDCSTIFAISTLLSSMQCYNLFHDIQEDDLNRLQFLADYAILLQQQQQTSDAQFQDLLFIMRNWSDSVVEYGWNRQIINETFDENPKQTPEMRIIRKKIQASFQQIRSFFMPHPGAKEADSKTFSGNMQDIDPLFMEYLEMLVPGLLAPENLVVKVINEEKVKAQDFGKYVLEYMKAFTGNQRPTPRAIFEVRHLLIAPNSPFYQFTNPVILYISTDPYYQATAKVYNPMLVNNLFIEYTKTVTELMERNMGKKQFAVRRHAQRAATMVLVSTKCTSSI